MRTHSRLPRINFTYPVREGHEHEYAKIDAMQFHLDEQIAGEYSNFFNVKYKGYDEKQYVDRISGKWVIKFPRGDIEVNRVSHRLIEALEQNKLFNFKVSKPSNEFKEQLICVYALNSGNEKEVKATYNALLSMGIPRENIMGYKRNVETILDSQHNHPLDDRIDFYLYDNNAKLTQHGSIMKTIDAISSRWVGSELTKNKIDILNDFWKYYHRHFSNKRSTNFANLAIITAWVSAYESAHEGQNPFDTLTQQRRTSCLRMFKPTDTDSVKLFKKLVGTNDEYDANQLQRIIIAGVNVKAPVLVVS